MLTKVNSFLQAIHERCLVHIGECRTVQGHRKGIVNVLSQVKYVQVGMGEISEACQEWIRVYLESQ